MMLENLKRAYPKKKRFMQMLKDGEMVFAPCVWDCYSALAAQMVGFQAMLLSGASLSRSLMGIPDLGIMNAEEIIRASGRIARFSSIPLIVDFDEGYGDSPLNVYHNVSRLVELGVQGFTLDDGQGFRGAARMPRARLTGKRPYEHMPVHTFIAKIKAAQAAIEGTDCVLIARTEVRINDGFDEAIERCVRAEEAGAHMTMINNVRGIEEARYLNERVKGWKMYPDIVSHDGETDADLSELLSMNYNFVTMHYLEDAALGQMVDFGRHVFADKSTVYPDTHRAEYTDAERAEMGGWDYNTWLDLEEEINGGNS